MKLKQFILAVVVTVSVISCSKQDLVVPQSQTQPTATQTVAVQTTSTTESTNLAYIFIEPVSKVTLVSKYLKDSVSHSYTTGVPFVGFSAGYGITSTNKSDVLNYMNLKYFYNGQLPSVITTEVPQITGGTDTYGNPITAYNFKTVRINKSLIGETAWVTVFIPVNAMNNDTKKQVKIESKGTGLATQQIIQNSTLYGYTFNYTGNKIPQGTYRMYTTFVNATMRFPFTGSGYIDFRGNGN